MSDDTKPPVVEYRPTQLIICPGIDFDEWQTAWNNLDQTSRSINWLLGDALIFGAQAYPEQWAQVLSPKYAEQHRGIMRVALRIPPQYRKASLSWSAHREAASAETLEERVELLDLAEANDWGSREIAEEIRKRRDRRRPGWNMGPPLEDEPSPPSAEEPASAAPPEPEPEIAGSTRNRTPRILPASPPAKEPAPVVAPAVQATVVPGRAAYQPSPPRDLPPSAEEIRAAIVAVRQIANPMVLQQAPEPDVREAETRIASAVRLPVSLRDTDQSLLAIPPQWRIRMMESGEHVFGGRMWTVELIRGKTQVAIGVCPSLPCAVLEAAMSAMLSDMGAG